MLKIQKKQKIHKNKINSDLSAKKRAKNWTKRVFFENKDFLAS